jgi:hypothetical protein
LYNISKIKNYRKRISILDKIQKKREQDDSFFSEQIKEIRRNEIVDYDNFFEEGFSKKIFIKYLYEADCLNENPILAPG